MVTNPEAITYCNDVLRPLSDMLAGSLDTIRRVLTDKRPDARDLLALFPEGGGPIADGSPDDGRHTVSSDQCRALFRLCEVLDTLADNDTDPDTGLPTGLTSRALVAAFAVNPRK